MAAGESTPSLRRQTRSHGDLDLVIQARHERAFVQQVREHGFDHVPMWYTTDAHTVWRDGAGRTVDLHLIVIDGNGDGAYGVEGSYPARGLAGRDPWWRRYALPLAGDPSGVPPRLRDAAPGSPRRRAPLREVSGSAAQRVPALIPVMT